MYIHKKLYVYISSQEISQISYVFSFEVNLPISISLLVKYVDSKLVTQTHLTQTLLEEIDKKALLKIILCTSFFNDKPMKNRGK